MKRHKMCKRNYSYIMKILLLLLFCWFERDFYFPFHSCSCHGDSWVDKCLSLDSESLPSSTDGFPCDTTDTCLGLDLGTKKKKKKLSLDTNGVF